ncbi:MAG: hypothetical protein M1815_001995 [Lichina confinis]|nr:MAG: hypothetical protein M1815_001995 [Lichina confinis]
MSPSRALLVEAPTSFLDPAAVMPDHHHDDASVVPTEPTAQGPTGPNILEPLQGAQTSTSLPRPQGELPSSTTTIPLWIPVDDSTKVPEPSGVAVGENPAGGLGGAPTRSSTAPLSMTSSTPPLADSDKASPTHVDRIPRLSINPLALPGGHVAFGGSGLKRSGSSAAAPRGTPSWNSKLSPSVSALESSPSSTLSSPAFGPVLEITPLPSPIAREGSPRPWDRKMADPDDGVTGAAPSPTNDEARPPSATSLTVRKPYRGLLQAAIEDHGPHEPALNRDRSISDYAAGDLHVTRPRVTTVSGPVADSGGVSLTEPCLKREEYLAESRGIARAVPQVLTPPLSDPGVEMGDSEATAGALERASEPGVPKPAAAYFEAVAIGDSTRYRWKALRRLGQGTFSEVVLAIEVDREPAQNGIVNGVRPESGEGAVEAEDDAVAPRRLVAVKVVEHGPTGGASEERVESSLKRELEIMKLIDHASLVHLKASSIEPTRALLVLSYCPGGDLFDFACQRRALLSPPLIRRIFAELVMATLYLHERSIVHRDIKLENILLNLRASTLGQVGDWSAFPYSVVTLTDLGLSRRIEPQKPLLQTRCGSEDYAAPELLMGEAYDGRQTDAWALAVVLYALMEGRLPFDALPGAKDSQKTRTRTVHRIARCDFRWYKFTDADGAPANFGPLEPARRIVEGLLRRAVRRTPLVDVANDPWIKDAVAVDGGLRLGDLDD